MADAIKNPGDEGFVPYFERRGLAARGVADQWLAWYRQQEQKTYKATSPTLRQTISRENEAWAQRQYAALRHFEMREVRQGETKAIEQNIADRSSSSVESVLAQIRAESEWADQKRVEIAVNNAGDAMVNGAPDATRHAEHEAAVTAQVTNDTLTHIRHLLADIEDMSRMYDVAAAKALCTPEDAIVRKRMMGGATYCNAIDSLIASGHDAAAERFVDAVDLERDTDGKPVPKGKDKDGKPVFKQNEIAKTLGISSEKIATFRAAIQRVRDRKAADQKREAAARAKQAKDAAREMEIALHLRPIPDDEAGQSAYFERMGVDYAELANDPTLPPETRLGYAKTARALGFQSIDSKTAAARQKKAEVREAMAERREQLRELKALTKEMQDETFALHESDFMAGGYFDENGNWIDHTAASMKETADTCLADGKLSRVQWHKLMTMQQKQYGDEISDFRNLVMADVRKVVPSCVTWHRNRFHLSPNNKVNAATATSRRGGEDDEKLSYRQMVEAMNLTIEWWKQKGKGASINDAKKHFDELTQGLVRGRMQKNIDAALEEEKQLINDWRMTNGRRLEW